MVGSMQESVNKLSLKPTNTISNRATKTGSVDDFMIKYMFVTEMNLYDEINNPNVSVCVMLVSDFLRST